MTVEQLLADYSVEPGALITVDLPEGALTFQPVRRYGQFTRLTQEALAWWQGPKPKGLAAVWPESAEEAAAAYFISVLSVEPKIDLAQACRLLGATFLVQKILAELNAGSKALGDVWLAKAVEAEKKGSEPTEPSEPSAPSAEGPGDELPPS